MKAKTYTSNFLILLLTAVMVSVSAQRINAQGDSTKKNAERLIGTWTLDYDKSIAQAEPNSKMHYDSLKQERKDRIRTSFSGRKITFHKTGGYMLEIKEGVSSKGTWKLLDDQITLVIQLDHDRQYKQQIEVISTSTMTLNLGGDQKTERLFRKWHLQKQKN